MKPESRAVRQSLELGDPTSQLIVIWGLNKKGKWSCKDSAKGTLGAAYLGGVCIPQMRVIPIQYQMKEVGAFWICSHKPLILKNALVCLLENKYCVYLWS